VEMQARPRLQTLPRSSRFLPNQPNSLTVAIDGRVFHRRAAAGRVKIWKPQTGSLVVAGQIPSSRKLRMGCWVSPLDPGFDTNNWCTSTFTCCSRRATPGSIHNERDTIDLSSEKILLHVPLSGQCCHSGGFARVWTRRLPVHLGRRQYIHLSQTVCAD